MTKSRMALVAVLLCVVWIGALLIAQCFMPAAPSIPAATPAPNTGPRESICIQCYGLSQFIYGSGAAFYSDAGDTQTLYIDGAGGNIDAEGSGDFAGDLTAVSVSASGNLTVTGNGSLSGLLTASCVTSVLTGDQTLTPTASCYQFTPADNLSLTLEVEPAGTILFMQNISETYTVWITDTNIRTTDGDGVSLGEYDIAIWQSTGSEWYLVANSANQ
jgi:hypothetical protein